jgi:methionine salvage enolase-phosphatase E1
MFLDNLSTYSVPLIGIVFVIIGLSFSKTISLFTYQQKKQRQPVYHHMDKSHVSIQINPFSQLDDINTSQQRLTTLTLDDDEELIKSDISSISSSCENSSIELRLKQDVEYEYDN